MNERGGYFTKDSVRNIIKNKAWYSFDPATGAYNWSLSVQAIAKQLLINPRDAKTSIENSFTPKCLTQVEIPGKLGLSRKKPLLKVLKDEGIDTYIWTVGDKDWQKTKFFRSGAAKFVKEDHYFFLRLIKKIL